MGLMDLLFGEEDPRKRRERQLNDQIRGQLNPGPAPGPPPTDNATMALTPEEQAAAEAKKAQVDAGIAALLEEQRKKKGLATPGVTAGY